MTKHFRWFAVLGWAVLMLIVWSLFVPKGLSVGTFTLLAFTGAVVAMACVVLWRAQRPEPSIRQIRAALDDGSPGARR